jgi:hypothetical protein
VSPVELVARHLADPQASFAIGTFGAIAEFHRGCGEPVVLSSDSAVTRRGGIRLQLNGAVRAVAWERPASGDSWTHGIALCLSEAHGAMSGRRRPAELGPDAAALREEDREDVLFDLGIGAPHRDFCVRTSDAEIVRALRSASDRPELAAGLFRELAALSPARVILSRLGRLEVNTPIPAPEGKTLDGPHTHVCGSQARDGGSGAFRQGALRRAFVFTRAAACAPCSAQVTRTVRRPFRVPCRVAQSIRSGRLNGAVDPT